VLLEPVRRAAQKAALAKELLDNKICSPRSMVRPPSLSLPERSADMEGSRSSCALPNWWSARQPPRAQVQVRIGTKKASAVGLDQLLDFSVGMSLDGEGLTDGGKKPTPACLGQSRSFARQVG